MSSPTPISLDGVRVAIFEARMADSLADMVRKFGGVPISAPSMREIPLGASPEIQAFAAGLAAGAFDLVIFETGVGVRYLAEAMRSSGSPEAASWLDAVRQTRIIARGPKPAKALRELGLPIHAQVPEPNTWRETLALFDTTIDPSGLRIALQEYGQPVPELSDGLARRGANVIRVPVYRWALPEDLAPLRGAIARIVAGKIDAALFTAAQQVEHVVSVAAQEGHAADLRRSLSSNVVVGSIGPTTTATLRQHGFPVDIEPEHPKSGHLVSRLASEWSEAIKRKKAADPSKFDQVNE